MHQENLQLASFYLVSNQPLTVMIVFSSNGQDLGMSHGLRLPKASRRQGSVELCL